MGASPIEWTGHTINPLRGRLKSDPSKVGHYCEKVSPGCAACYASRFQPRPGLPPFSGTHGRGLELVEPFLDVSKLEEVLRRRKPTTWFWCDMTDMFGSWVTNEQIAACFGVMAATPWHTHQVLTKRAERLALLSDPGVLESFEVMVAGEAERRAGIVWDARGQERHLYPPNAGDLSRRQVWPGWPLPNVWLGVSVEDQQRADERIPHLLRTPAAVRFLSCEPLLGPVDLRSIPGGGALRINALNGGWDVPRNTPAHRQEPRIHWVISGGESGPGARLNDVAWMRLLREQCAAAGVPYFGKQLGARPVDAAAFCWNHHSIEQGEERLYGPGGKHAATLWKNSDGRVTWHTWDPRGLGGENAVDADVPTAKSEALRAVMRAGHYPLRLRDRKGGDPAEWPEDLRVRQMPEASHA